MQQPPFGVRVDPAVASCIIRCMLNDLIVRRMPTTAINYDEELPTHLTAVVVYAKTSSLVA